MAFSQSNRQKIEMTLQNYASSNQCQIYALFTLDLASIY